MLSSTHLPLASRCCSNSSSPYHEMRLLATISIILSVTLAVASFAHPSGAIEKRGLFDQFPIVAHHDAVTKTRTITHTRFEINVVSTIHKTRPLATPTSFDSLAIEPEEMPPATQSNSGSNDRCSLEVCAVCRLLNNCYEGFDPWYGNFLVF